MIADPFAVLVVLAAIVLIALKLEEHVTLFRSLGAALVGILIGMLLSNLEVIPGESPVYDFLQGTGVNIGIVLILTSVNVRSLVEAGPSMLAAFAIGALGTTLGAIVAGLVLFRQIGEETWKLTGQFTGTYTGGGVNYAALGRAFDTSNDLFTAALAADVILTAICDGGVPRGSCSAGKAQTSTRSRDNDEGRAHDARTRALFERARRFAGRCRGTRGDRGRCRMGGSSSR